MAVGPVNQALLESNYQNAGDIYLDTKTEGAFQVVVDQVNANAGIFAAGGSALVVSDPIAGITGTNVYDQLSAIESQVQDLVGGVTPPGTITNAMLQTDSVDTRVLAPNAVTLVEVVPTLQTALIGAMLYTYRNIKGGF